MRAVSSLPSAPASGEVLMPMVIERLGSSTCSGVEGDRVHRVGQGLADRDVLEAGDRDDVAGPGALGRDAIEGLGDEELGDLGVLDRAVQPAPRHALAALERAVDDPAQRQATQVRRRVEVAHEGLESVVLVVDRARARSRRSSAKQRRQVAARGGRVARGPALARARVEDGERDLVLVGVQVQEEVLDLGDDLGDPGVGAVDLVDQQHDGQALLEGLAQDEAGLGQGALGGVDQQDDRVDHGQAPLDLAAEVRVTRRVDDVDRQVVPAHGRVLGEDRDALLALEVARVHDPVGQLLVRR